MFSHLQVYDRRERWMVGLADAALGMAAAALRPFGRRRSASASPRRILLLRLERIGDLLMSWPAIAAVGKLAPEAQIDLVVGSWNEPIARLLNGVSRVTTLDAAWLARGAAAPRWPGLVRRALAWRREGYDWAINFEGDIRSHLLMALSGAPRRIGFDMAGGGPVLTDRVPYDASSHVADNALRLVERAFGVEGHRAVPRRYAEQRLPVPAAARQRANALLAELERGARVNPSDGPSEPVPPLVGIHVSGGRDVKQWDPVRFGDVAARLAVRHAARLVFTGSEGDRALVDVAMARLPAGTTAMHVCGRSDLLTTAALLERVAVFVTGDTGPMHLAAAVGTPLVAIFGPSDAQRWGPLSDNARIITSDIACRPCNRIRRPPARCADGMADCLAGVSVDQVVAVVEQSLAEANRRDRAPVPGRGAATTEASDAAR